jgi:hypothetical protein
MQLAGIVSAPPEKNRQKAKRRGSGDEWKQSEEKYDEGDGGD